MRITILMLPNANGEKLPFAVLLPKYICNRLAKCWEFKYAVVFSKCARVSVDILTRSLAGKMSKNWKSTSTGIEANVLLSVYYEDCYFIDKLYETLLILTNLRV